MFVPPIQHKTVLFGLKLVLSAKVILTFSSFLSCIPLNIQHLREKKTETKVTKTAIQHACTHTQRQTQSTFRFAPY